MPSVPDCRPLAVLLTALSAGAPAMAQGELPLCESTGSVAAWNYEAAPEFAKISTDGVAICDRCRGASFDISRTEGKILVRFIPVFAGALQTAEFDVTLALSGWPRDTTPVSTEIRRKEDDGSYGYILDVTPLFGSNVPQALIDASSIEISARHASGEGVTLEIDALGLAEAWAAAEMEAARQSAELAAGRCEDIW